MYLKCKKRFQHRLSYIIICRKRKKTSFFSFFFSLNQPTRERKRKRFVFNGAKYPIFTLEITTRAEFFHNSRKYSSVLNHEDKFSPPFSPTKNSHKDSIASTAIRSYPNFDDYSSNDGANDSIKKREERHNVDDTSDPWMFTVVRRILHRSDNAWGRPLLKDRGA